MEFWGGDTSLCKKEEGSEFMAMDKMETEGWSIERYKDSYYLFILVYTVFLGKLRFNPPSSGL